MRNLKKPFLFTLATLPIAVVAVIFTCLYQFEMYPPEILQEAVVQLGSITILMLISVAQSTSMVLVCSFLGYILANKIGLWKPVRFEKSKCIKVLLLSSVMGILFSLDYWTFGNMISGIKEATLAGMTSNGIIASILYGGIIEEIMMRLFFMSLIAWGIWKLFFRKYEKEHIPNGVFIAANIVAALFFAAGHLPATLMTFGELTPMILVRCFLLNGGFGIMFGWFYRKYGLGYAMLSHMSVHIVSKIIWFVFV